jgi:5-methylcytosine-specific restriction enzyme A
MTEDVSTTPRKKLSPTARLKLFEKHKGVCFVCSQKIIGKFVVEHIRPLALGGSNEDSNLAPVHTNCSDVKTFGKEGDIARAAKSKRQKMAAHSIGKDSPKLVSRGFQKSDKPRSIDRNALPQLPRRALYE